MEVRVLRKSGEERRDEGVSGGGRQRKKLGAASPPLPLSRPKSGGVGCKNQRREMRKQRSLDLVRLWSGRIPLPSSHHSSLLPGTGIA